MIPSSSSSFDVERSTLNVGRSAAGVTLPTFPARPVNGGPLEKAAPKFGTWRAEPKINGWRGLLHVESGTIWNRHGERLSIEDSFVHVIKEVADCVADGAAWLATHPAGLSYPPVEFLDVECLDRRHSHGRGCLIVLDAVYPGTYADRRDILLELFPLLDLNERLTEPTVRLIPSFPDAAKLYAELQERNALYDPAWRRSPLNAFYEGIVCKRVDSLYPVQLRNPSTEFPRWMKHRFA